MKNKMENQLQPVLRTPNVYLFVEHLLNVFKNVLLLFFSVALFYLDNVFGQGNYPVQFPSPEATNLGLVGNLPVSLHTGKIAIDIPLNIGNDKKIPAISLSYNMSGVQPDAHPGWVGNNWTLNAGGVVTRIMNFIPDETSDIGYYYKYAQANTVSMPINYSAGGSACWSNICTEADGSPDEFFINAPGVSGKFMINSSGQFQMMEDPSIKVEVESINTYDYPRAPDVSEGAIGVRQPFVGFSITKNDGTKYRFGYRKELIEISCNLNNTAQPVGNGYASAWYLSQIIYPNRDTIKYEYTSKVKNVTPSGNDLNFVTYTSLYPRFTNRSGTYHAYLQSIEGPLTTIYFNTSTTNELSMGGGDIGNWKKLDSIVVYNKMAGRKEKSFEFKYDSSANKRLTLLSLIEKDSNGVALPPHTFIYDPTVLPPYQSAQTDFWGYYNGNTDSTNLPSVVWPENNMPFYFLPNREPNPNTVGAGILKQIKYPTGGSVLLEYEPNEYSSFYDYTFNSGPFYFPVKWKWSPVSTTTVLSNNPVETFYPFVTTLVLAAPQNAQIAGPGLSPSGITRTIPAGSYTVASFQTFLGISYTDPNNAPIRYTLFFKNDFATSSKAYGPGLRIKKVYYENVGTNMDLLKEYVYSKDYSKPTYDPGISSGILGNRLACVINPTIGVNRSGIPFGTPQGPSSLTEGSPIGYSEVTEITKDKNGNVLGFTVNKFTSFDTYPDDIPGGGGTNYIAIAQKGNRAFQRGKLLESIICDANGKTVKTVINNYNQLGFINSISNGITVRPNYIQGSPESGENNWMYDLIYIYSKNYFATSKLSYSTDTLFNSTGKDPISQYTGYTYNQYLLPSSIVSTTSKGKLKKIDYTYPFEIFSSPYTTMSAKHLLNYPIETTTYLDSVVTGSTLSTYQSSILNADTIFLIDKAYKLDNSSPLNAFAKFDGVNKDPNYLRPNLEIARYDNKGNPLEARDESGITIIYLWSYNSQYPVAKILGSDYVTVSGIVSQHTIDAATSNEAQMRSVLNALRVGLPNAQVWTYTYAPLIGMTSETDLNGRTTYYEYDPFNRLKTIRDQDGKVIKTIDYQYQKPNNQ